MRRLAIVALLAFAAFPGCGTSSGPNGVTGPGVSLEPRTYLVGFSGFPPRQDNALVIRTIDLWATRGDAALLLYEPPWAQLLAGDDPRLSGGCDPPIQQRACNERRRIHSA